MVFLIFPSACHSGTIKHSLTSYYHAEALMNKGLSTNLFQDIALLIESTKTQVARTVNSSLVLLYWKIGEGIYKEILGEDRAIYGENIIKE